MTAPLRLLVYDRTCRKRGVGLSTIWATGSALYERLGRIDAAFGAASWDEALRWIATYEPARPIGQVQYWGHGRWGRVLVDDDALDVSALSEAHPLHPRLVAIRERLVPGALVWLRTCETFGARRGLDFAERLADTLGVRVAGHTFIIGAVQSGLRALAPGCRPSWSDREGLAEGTPEAPERAQGSGLLRPRTVGFMTNTFPETWFDEDGRARGDVA